MTGKVDTAQQHTPARTAKSAARGAKRNRRLLGARLLLVCVSTLLSLLAVELGLRVYYHIRFQQALNNHRDDERGELVVVPSDKPGLIYTMRPNVGGANSHGYFDYEYSLQKPPGVFRIVVIGDSVAVGQNVGWQDSFAKLLEERLNTQRPERRWEVVVLARSGYSLSQELILLRDEAFDYQPDLLLWSYVLNDPAHPLYHDVSGDLRLLYRPKCYLAHLAAAGWFQLKEMAACWGGPTEFHKRLHYVYRDQIARGLHTIGRMCRENEVPAVLLIHPVFEEDRPFSQYSLLDVHADLRELAEESGLMVFDLLDAYLGHAPEELSYPKQKDPWHPNRLGHRLAADFIFDELHAAGLIPEQTPQHQRSGP